MMRLAYKRLGLQADRFYVWCQLFVFIGQLPTYDSNLYQKINDFFFYTLLIF